MRGTHCIDGEPTGDETPREDRYPTRTPERTCTRCGAPTTLSSRVCIDCELGTARPAATVTPLHPARRAA